jgi:hypothetical protein
MSMWVVRSGVDARSGDLVTLDLARAPDLGGRSVEQIRDALQAVYGEIPVSQVDRWAGEAHGFAAVIAAGDIVGVTDGTVGVVRARRGRLPL